MTPSPPASARPPLWKNPWAVSFAVGIVALTVLRFSQQAFLHAPPPGPSLGTWQLRTADGTPYGSQQLLGRVWIVSTATAPEALARFGSIHRHLDDLGEKIVLVSVVADAGAVQPDAGSSWVALTGDRAELEGLVMAHLRPAFVQFPPTVTANVDAGTTFADFAQLAAFGVVDQKGFIRGFWPDADLGRGNVINAARLLVKKPDPP